MQPHSNSFPASSEGVCHLSHRPTLLFVKCPHTLQIKVRGWSSHGESFTPVYQRRQLLPEHVKLNADEAERINRPVAGQGGFQSLLRGLQRNFDASTRLLTLTDEQIERIVRYTTEYGWGGFEGRLDGVRRNLPQLFE